MDGINKSGKLVLKDERMSISLIAKPVLVVEVVLIFNKSGKLVLTDEVMSNLNGHTHVVEVN